MLEKNQIFTGTVETLGSNGEGILRQNGIPVFVPYALPGEKITYKILKVRKSFAFGKALEIHTPAEVRVSPVCPVFQQCGGCQIQHVSYKGQRSWKTKLVCDCFHKIAHLDVNVDSIHPSLHVFGYRNKLQLAVGRDKNGTVVGFYAENSHRIVPIDGCAIHPEWGERAIGVFKKYLAQYAVEGYDEETGTGLVRHFVVRELRGKFIVTVVATRPDLPGIRDLYAWLTQYFPKLTLYVNVNRADTNVVFGPEFRLIAGTPRPKVTDSGLIYEVGPESFLQVNDSVRRYLYGAALAAAEIDSDTVVVDAYSGAGIMTAKFAQKAKLVYGIECVGEAVECADRLAAENRLTGKMRNLCGNCEDLLPPLLEEISARGEKCVVVLDPPRKGCDHAVIEALKRVAPEKILYISCNPATLARDVGLLVGSLVQTETGIAKSGAYEPMYKVGEVKPFDMFPQTKHVETLVVLTLKNHNI